MDIWIYGCVKQNDGWVSGRGLPPSPPKTLLAGMFMRGFAPQTPHRFNGYTSHLVPNFGYLDIWVSGYLDIRIFGYLDSGKKTNVVASPI